MKRKANTRAHSPLRGISCAHKTTQDVPSVGCHGKSGPLLCSSPVPPSPLCSTTTLYYSSLCVPHLYHSVTPYAGRRFCLSPLILPLPLVLFSSLPFLHPSLLSLPHVSFTRQWSPLQARDRPSVLSTLTFSA